MFADALKQSHTRRPRLQKQMPSPRKNQTKQWRVSLGARLRGDWWVHLAAQSLHKSRTQKTPRSVDYVCINVLLYIGLHMPSQKVQIGVFLGCLLHRTWEARSTFENSSSSLENVYVILFLDLFDLFFRIKSLSTSSDLTTSSMLHQLPGG